MKIQLPDDRAFDRAFAIVSALLAVALMLVSPSLLGGLAAQVSTDGDAVAGDSAAVSAVLDAFHRAASEADGDRYFGLFADDGVFLGTDAGEHWTVEEFREYARPYFDRGQGWTYRPTERHVYFAPSGRVAWFDELLENDGLGRTRGTGVLIIEDGDWRVSQYHLTIPVPNEIVGEVVDRIRDAEASGQ